MAAGRKRTLQIDILMDPNGMKRGVGQAQQATDRLSGSVSNLAGTMRRLVAGGALIALGRSAVNAAIDAEEAASAFNTTFGRAASKAGEFVEQFANRAGMANYQLHQMMAVTGNVVQGLGATEDQSLQLSRQMVELAADVASFINAEGGAEAVMLALQSAINGEREALKTYGLALSEAEVQQKALEMSGKSTVAELTRMDKALATVELAYAKAGKAVGDLERTQESTANQAREARARFEELKVALGQQLVPVVGAATEGALNFSEGVQLIVDWFENLPGPAKKAALAITGVAAALIVIKTHPVLAGLALVVGAITAIGAAAREQRERVEKFRAALEELGEVKPPDLTKLLTSETLQLLTDAGYTLNDVAAAIGDTAAMQEIAVTATQRHSSIMAVQQAVFKGLRLDLMSLNQAHLDNRRAAEIQTAALMKAADQEQRAEQAARRLAAANQASASTFGLSSRTAEEWSEVLDTAKKKVIELANAQIEAASPTLQLLNAQKSLAEAQAAYAETMADATASDEDRLGAQLNLIEAQGRLEGAQATMAANVGTSLDAFRDLAEEAGIYGDELERIIGLLWDYDRAPKPKPNPYDPFDDDGWRKE